MRAKWGVCLISLLLAKMSTVAYVLRCSWRMGGKVSMSARREITKKPAAKFGNESRRATGVMLDQLVATTGWSRANARRALTAAGKRMLKPTRDDGR